jgi:putative PIN family toxin of toxin-antitoxin system
VPSAGDVRAVIDTNVLLSGLLWRGTPHRLIEEVRAGALTLITGPALLAELGEVIRGPKLHTILARSRIDPKRALRQLRRSAETVEPSLAIRSGQLLPRDFPTARHLELGKLAPGFLGAGPRRGNSRKSYLTMH